MGSWHSQFHTLGGGDEGGGGRVRRIQLKFGGGGYLTKFVWGCSTPRSKPLSFNPLTPRSDQYVNSPFNIILNTLSSR